MLTGSQSRNSPHFMDSTDSLPRLLIPATYPFLEPNESSPLPRFPLPEDPSYYYKPIDALVIQVVSLPQVSHQSPVCTSSLHHTCYVPCSYNSSGFDPPNNIWWRVHIGKVLMMYFSPPPCYLAPLRPKYSPYNPILNYPQPAFLP